MPNELVGTVSQEEKEEIQSLYQRKLALDEMLFKFENNASILRDENLYEKLVSDMGRTNYQSQRWWSEKGEKYQWKGNSKGRWVINFDTNEIFLEFDVEWIP